MNKICVLIGIFVIGVFCNDLLITQDKIDFLKKHVTKYEIASYEENIFKGWSIEEAKEILTIPDYKMDRMSLYSNMHIEEFDGYSEKVPSDLDWRQAKPACILEPKFQNQCSSSWAFTAAHMLSERVFF